MNNDVRPTVWRGKTVQSSLVNLSKFLTVLYLSLADEAIWMRRRKSSLVVCGNKREKRKELRKGKLVNQIVWKKFIICTSDCNFKSNVSMYEHNHVDQSGQKFRDKYRVFQRSQLKDFKAVSCVKSRVEKYFSSLFNNNELLKN